MSRTARSAGALHDLASGAARGASLRYTSAGASTHENTRPHGPTISFSHRSLRRGPPAQPPGGPGTDHGSLLACRPRPVRGPPLASQQDRARGAIRMAYAAGCRELGENRCRKRRARPKRCRTCPIWEVVGDRPSSDQQGQARRALRQRVPCARQPAWPKRWTVACRPKGARNVWCRSTRRENRAGSACAGRRRGLRSRAASLLLAARAWPDDPRPIGERARPLRPCFTLLRDLRSACGGAPADVAMDELSMGMSGDLELAVEEGATIVRVVRRSSAPRSAGRPLRPG